MVDALGTCNVDAVEAIRDRRGSSSVRPDEVAPESAHSSRPRWETLIPSRRTARDDVADRPRRPANGDARGTEDENATVSPPDVPCRPGRVASVDEVAVGDDGARPSRLDVDVLAQPHTDRWPDP